MKPLHTLLTLLALFAALHLSAQEKAQIEEQRRVIANLEKRIAAEEQEIANLKKGKSSTQAKAKRLARQISSRNQLLQATTKQARRLDAEIDAKTKQANELSSALERNKEQYREMVREGYRNYRHQNYLTYLFSSGDFHTLSKRLATLREMASYRERKLQEISAQSQEVAQQRAVLDSRKHELDSVKGKLTAQKRSLERDERNARASIQQLSKKEKQALQRKMAQEEQLSVAIERLRKLTKGNKEGASFSSKTSGLRLPVKGGSVKRYKGNMAEITGPQGAEVISIYEGKVVDAQLNRITGKYEVYVAHGEYISSYANMDSICVEKGQKVAKNQPIGTIGSWVDVMTMKTSYRLIFGIYPPRASMVIHASTCFQK